MQEKPKGLFKRPCNQCGETYKPTGRYQKMCDDCHNFINVNKGVKMWMQRGEDTLRKNDKILIDKKNIYLKDELKHLIKILEKYTK